MSLSLVQSRALMGLEATAVTVEVHLANGLPQFTLVGLADTEVKEARCSENQSLSFCLEERAHGKNYAKPCRNHAVSAPFSGTKKH